MIKLKTFGKNVQLLKLAMTFFYANKSSDFRGNFLYLFPVALYMALTIAGAITGTPGSPIPVGISPFSTISICTFGVS